MVTLANKANKESLVLSVPLVTLEIPASLPSVVNRACPDHRDSPDYPDSSELPDSPVYRELLVARERLGVLERLDRPAYKVRRVQLDLLETPAL